MCDMYIYVILSSVWHVIVTCFIVCIVSVSVVACFSRGVEEKSWDSCCLNNGMFLWGLWNFFCDVSCLLYFFDCL